MLRVQKVFVPVCWIKRFKFWKYLFLINSELNGSCGGLCSEVVHSSFESLFPSHKMHWGQRSIFWLGNMDIKGLRLVNEWASVRSHLKNIFLFDLPNSAVNVFDVLWNVEILHWTVVVDNLLPHVLVPQFELGEVTQQVRVYHLQSGWPRHFFTTCFLLKQSNFSKKNCPGAQKNQNCRAKPIFGKIFLTLKKAKLLVRRGLRKFWILKEQNLWELKSFIICVARVWVPHAGRWLAEQVSLKKSRSYGIFCDTNNER